MATVVFLLVGLEITGAGNSHLTDFPLNLTESNSPPTVPTTIAVTGRETIPVTTTPETTRPETETTTLAVSSTEAVTWEPMREYRFPMWDKTGRLCLLAEFRATFTIFYKNRLGDQKVVVHLPKNPHVKGICASNSQNPILQMFWSEFSYSLIFSKLPHRDKEDGEFWGVKSMELTYDSAGPLFGDASDAGKKSATFLEDDIWLKVPLNKSYYCKSPEPLYLYDSKKEKTVMVVLDDVQIQPYGIVNGQFSEAHQCSEATVESRSQIVNRDETVPMAVGSTFAILTLIGVSGYAAYRTMTARRVDYSTME
ncbi:lysosome-associated membrane glycoprotein 5-like [Centruroides sculpturatus]|uniref:lysosome-associated membrane glycoprotein 5-like n=1 Tax=Centruroides sculpturatus TaxID=218467 RepID=UPI000C6EE23B|nr:lysosome-associated membrane glycoprotein 5-like [Centruroides sculpturatus]